mgnify:CR=1 FL=1
MHSICPVEQAQMDFFDVLPVAAVGDDQSIESLDCATTTEASAVEGGREDNKPRKPQLSLQLPNMPLNDFSWSDQEVCAFLDGMLVDQLRLLADERTTPELRADLIAWIAAPRRSLQALKKAPFSFQACCAAVGVDFEEMRERTLEMFAPELVDELD